MTKFTKDEIGKKFTFKEVKKRLWDETLTIPNWSTWICFHNQWNFKIKWEYLILEIFDSSPNSSVF
jgi:hypothetical protein